MVCGLESKTKNAHKRLSLAAYVFILFFKVLKVKKMWPNSIFSNRSSWYLMCRTLI